MIKLRSFITQLQELLAKNEAAYGPDDECGMIDASIVVFANEGQGYSHMDYLGIDVDGTICLKAVRGYGKVDCTSEED